VQQEANRKRAEAARKQKNRANQYTAPKAKQVDREVEVNTQPVYKPAKYTGKTNLASAIASKTNRGTVERMDRLYRKRPTLVLLILLSLWGMWWGTGFVVKKTRGCELK